MSSNDNNVNNKLSAAASTTGDISRGVWSLEEHDRFLEALQRFPNGPWKAVAEHVGSRSVRQVQTHAQKYHEKVARRLRGLRKDRKRVLRLEHRIDDDMMELWQDLKRDAVPLPSRSSQRRATPRLDDEVDHGLLPRQFDREETKLSERIVGVNVGDGMTTSAETKDSDKQELEEEGKGIDPAFSQYLDFLIEALSPSDSDYESL